MSSDRRAKGGDGVTTSVDSAGFDRFAEIANAHVGDDKVPGLVAAVSVGD